METVDHEGTLKSLYNSKDPSTGQEQKLNSNWEILYETQLYLR